MFAHRRLALWAEPSAKRFACQQRSLANPSELAVIVTQTVTKWDRKWSDEQRAAIIRAFIELHIRPMTKIARMAAAGELSAEAGADPLPGFAIPYGTVVSIGRLAEKRARGERMRPHLAKLPARDRAEDMQRRLTSILDRELERIELAQRKRPKTPADAEQIRRVVRAMKELATLPDYEEKRLPKALGQRDADGQITEGASRDSLAGKLLAASDQSMSPTVRTQATTYATETSTAERSAHGERVEPSDEHARRKEDGEDGEPRSPQHDHVAGSAGLPVAEPVAPAV